MIWFDVESYSPGYGGDRYQPPEGAGYEFAITAIQIDGSPTDDASWPLTDAERAEIEAWFWNHQDQATSVAENEADDFGDRADYEYDRWRDEQMEKGL